MKKKTLLIMALCIALTSAHAQVITKIGRATLPLSDTATPGFYDKGSNGSFNISWFSYDYPSVGGDGQPVTLSALAYFCPSSSNGDHIGTGMEFFFSAQRLECIRTLASAGTDGIAAATMLPVSTPKWYDIYGRPVMRNSFAKGILINGGKKYMVR